MNLAPEERARFEAHLADLSSRFVNIDPHLIDGAIEDALRQFGELLDVDRGALTQMADDGSTLVFTHSWSRGGEHMPHVPLDAAQTMPFGLARLMKGEAHYFSRLDELPPGGADREYLARRGTRSAAAVPLVAGGRVIGSLGFGTTRHERQWDANVVDRACHRQADRARREWVHRRGEHSRPWHDIYRLSAPTIVSEASRP